ncbi:MAG TPA: hypothetical protein VK968_00605, partial [Roseimicrobium sp.]|nr:hypothetical protein [Roseimicrobium sp.]
MGILTFALDGAAWPVLLVDHEGVILRANESARQVFSVAIEESVTNVAALWAPENEFSSPDFLHRWYISPKNTASIKYIVKGGVAIALQTWLSPVTIDERALVLMQVFHSSSVASGNTAFLEKTGVRAEAMDAGLAHKQKLDCALQLARTVALDFNNALTSILGHTSLVLSKMEPTHPLRKSLLEVEKSAERAAEIAHD